MSEITKDKIEQAINDFPPQSEIPFDGRYISEMVFIHQDVIRFALDLALALNLSEEVEGG